MCGSRSTGCPSISSQVLVQGYQGQQGLQGQQRQELPQMRQQAKQPYIDLDSSFHKQQQPTRQEAVANPATNTLKRSTTTNSSWKSPDNNNLQEFMLYHSMVKQQDSISYYIKFIQDLCNQPELINLMTSYKICEYFQINPQQFLAISGGVEARENYIISCMNSSVKQNLEQWLDKIEQRELASKNPSSYLVQPLEEDGSNNRLQHQLPVKSDNIKKMEHQKQYEWLQIKKMKYPELGKKVKTQILHTFFQCQEQNFIQQLQAMHKHTNEQENLDGTGNGEPQLKNRKEFLCPNSLLQTPKANKPTSSYLPVHQGTGQEEETQDTAMHQQPYLTSGNQSTQQHQHMTTMTTEKKKQAPYSEEEEERRQKEEIKQLMKYGKVISQKNNLDELHPLSPRQLSQSFKSIIQQKSLQPQNQGQPQQIDGVRYMLLSSKGKPPRIKSFSEHKVSGCKSSLLLNSSEDIVGDKVPQSQIEPVEGHQQQMQQSDTEKDQANSSEAVVKEEPVIVNEQIKQYFLLDQSKFNWNAEKEKEFMEYRSQAKNRLINAVKSSNYNSISFTPAIQALNLEISEEQRRTALLQQYAHGEGLTPEELSFMAKTSPLLNHFTDKKLIQRSLDLLDSSVIDEIELQIADEALFRHEQIQKHMIKQRHGFLTARRSLHSSQSALNLKERTKQSYHWQRPKGTSSANHSSANSSTCANGNTSANVSSNNTSCMPSANANAMVNQQQSKNQIQQQKLQALSKLQEHRIRQKLVNQLRILSEKQKKKISNPIVLRFVEKLFQRCYIMTAEEKKLQQQQHKGLISTGISSINDFSERNFPKKQPRILFTARDKSELDVEHVKRLFHPSSKVIVGLNKLHRFYNNSFWPQQRPTTAAGPNNSSGNLDGLPTQAINNGRSSLLYSATDDHKDISSLEYQKKVMNQYKLGVRKQDFCKDTGKYVQFYSNGPIRFRQFSTPNLQHNFEKIYAVGAEEQQLQKEYMQKHLLSGEPLPPEMHQWITPAIENRAALVIQKFFRAYQHRKYYINNKINHHYKQGRAIDEKVRRMIQSKGLINAIKTQVNQAKAKRKVRNSLSLLVGDKFKQGNLMSARFGSETPKLSQSPLNKLPHQLKILIPVSPPLNKPGLSQQPIADGGKQVQHQQQQSFFQSPLISPQGSRSNSIMSGGKATLLPANQTTFRSAGQSNNTTLHNNPLQMQPKKMPNDKEQEIGKEQEKILNSGGGLLSPSSSPSSVCFEISRHSQKEKEAQEQYKERERRKQNRIKHKKLLYAVKKFGHLVIILNSGFVYTQDDVNIQDELGNCPLFYAAQNNDTRFVRWLVEQGADLNMRCKDGFTPLHMIFKGNDMDLIIESLYKGGDLNCINNLNETPIAYASKQTLERLGLANAVAIVKAGENNIISFDNNALVNKGFNDPKQQFKGKTKATNNISKLKILQQKEEAEIEGHNVGTGEYLKQQIEKDSNNKILQYQFNGMSDYGQSIRSCITQYKVPIVNSYMTPKDRQERQRQFDILQNRLKMLEQEIAAKEQEKRQKQQKRRHF